MLKKAKIGGEYYKSLSVLADSNDDASSENFFQ